MIPHDCAVWRPPLYNFTVWRQEHINDTTTGAERKAALCSLLEQEAQLIASIGRHKVVADEQNKDSESIRFLNKVGPSFIRGMGRVNPS